MHIDRRRLLTAAGATVAVSVIARRAVAQSAAPVGPPPLKVFANLPAIDHIALSPDGQRIAYIAPSGDTRVLGCIDLATKAGQTRTFGPVRIHDLFWADDKRVVVVNFPGAYPGETPVGPMRHQIYRAEVVDLDSHEMTRLFDGTNDFWLYGDNLGRVKAGGQYFVTASTWSMSQGAQVLWRFDPTARQAPHMIDNEREVENWVLDPAGACLGYAASHDSEHSQDRTWSLYIDTDPSKPSHDYKKVMFIKGGTQFPRLVGAGRDGKSLLIMIAGDDGAVHYREVSLDGTVGAPLEAADRLGARPLFDPVTGALAGFSYRDDALVYDYADPLLKKLMASVPQIIGDDYRFKLVDFAEDPRKMIVYGESATDAGSYFFLDFSTGAGLPLNSDYPNLPQAWIAQAQPIRYKAADGLDIHGYLTLPPGKPATALPLIVMPHSEANGRDEGDFDWQAQAFASRGYAVLQANIRGSSGYGPSFTKAAAGEWGGKMQSDLIDGIKALAAQGTIDAKRVAIYGAGDGGYAALAGATLDPVGTYRCAVSIDGVSDVRVMVENDRSHDSETTTIGGVAARGLWMRNVMDLLGDPARYDAVSPARQAAKAYCPILLIQGSDDTSVPLDQSQRMAGALKGAGKTVQSVTLPVPGHGVDLSAGRLAMIEAAMAFIGQYNPA